jgi:predicted ATPase/transcriptional regulator with XRE-family HTH domain
MMAQQEDGNHPRSHTFSHTVAMARLAWRGVISVEQERVAGSAFGALLRRHRLAAGLSQEILAERARMSVNGISALERGERRSPYRETVVLLAKALKLAPAAAAELEAAAARPRPQRPSFSGSAAAVGLGPATTPASNLPLQVTSFIGRETEIAEITALLGKHRLVTLTGSGGVGKTRTSLQVAANAIEGSGDGVWFIELAPLSSGDYVPTTIAHAVGMTLDARGDPIDQLVAALKSKNMLLVLDNCEHLVDASARIVAALISACPRIRILASSRQGLGIVGEATYRMPSLPVPPTAAVSGSGDVGADAALQFATVALFVERAKAVNNRFELTDENAPCVADICRRLDGIALPIELAAARLKMLSPQQLCDRLGERFRVLTGGGRDRLPRHQTLRALIDWSHDLLDERERTLFRRLGIFANGFTLEAASAVGGGEDLDAFEVFDLLASLVEKSLVIADPQGDSVRYHLLESTREYALEKLVESGERSWSARRHAEWVATFVEGADETYWTLPMALWLAPFEGELDNLRTALHWALEERGDAVVGGRIAGGAANLWFDAGLTREGRRWVDAALASLDETTHPRVVGQLWLAQAHVTHGEARIVAAGRAIRRLEPLGDQLRLARAYVILGYGHFLMQSLDLCLVAGERALTVLRSSELAQPALRARALGVRGTAFLELKRYTEARTAYGEALSVYRQMGDERRCLGIEIALGELEFAAGQVRAALALSRTVASRAREVADVCEALARANTAAYALAMGEIAEAKREACATLTLARSTQLDLQSIIAIQHLATVAVLEDDIERAARLRGYVDARYAALGYEQGLTEQRAYDILMTGLRARSSDERIAQLAEVGARLSDDDAAAEALGGAAAYDERRA